MCTIVHSLPVLTSKFREARNYRIANGKSPFEEWFKNLKDVAGKARVAVRIERAEKGNFGTYRDLKDGLFELKDLFGPGYRVYFGLDKGELIILLVGGSKRSQSRDIAKARNYLADYLRRTKE